ncbi:MAG: acetylornithine deacetylase [Ahrensia sp.]|nr:acetylornithine deacetylase [Ahrensia sp.]
MLNANPTAQDCIDALGHLVSFDTVSHNSNLALIESVANALSDIGVESRLTHNEEGTKANLWATIGPADRGGIVLSGHTDVVPVENQDWSSDPFVMEERDGLLYGRGTSDMKGFVACAFAHAAQMAKTDLKVPIHLAFSYDEEVGCTGVIDLVEDVSANFPKPLAVIVGEPTMMQIVGGHKGGRSYTTTVRGVDGHSSAPDLGANAIFAAARIVSYLQEVQARLKEQADRESGFSPPYTTVDCGLITGGTAFNIIPAECSFGWGLRSVPGEDTDAIVADIFNFIETQVEPGLKAISPQAGVSHVQRNDLPPFAPDESSPAESLLRHMIGQNRSGRVAYGTEASRFQEVGIPAVVFGPGSIEQAHIPDEFIAIEQIHKCHDFLNDLTRWAASHDRIA